MKDSQIELLQTYKKFYQENIYVYNTCWGRKLKISDIFYFFLLFMSSRKAMVNHFIKLPY